MIKYINSLRFCLRHFGVRKTIQIVKGDINALWMYLNWKIDNVEKVQFWDIYTLRHRIFRSKTMIERVGKPPTHSHCRCTTETILSNHNSNYEG